MSAATSATARNAWRLGRTPRICIVGAGFSSLVCARQLSQQGMDVTILEARDRVGGRVHQDNSLGHWTDMGANWIHGPSDNPIRRLAKEVDSRLVDIDETTPVYDEDGRLLPEERVKKVEGALWGTIEEAFKYAAAHGDEIPVTMSLKDYMTEQINQKDMSDADKRLVLQMSELWGGYIGTPYERQSLKYLTLESSLDGENSFIASTYRDILLRVSQQSLEKVRIEYKILVTSVRYGLSATDGPAGSVTVVGSKPLSEPQVSGSDMMEWTGDAVVMTVPLGCLREKQVSFSPELTQELAHAIDSISYGNLEKVYLRFPAPFWQSSKSDPQSFFSHFVHPKYAENNPGKWDIAMVNLASLGPKVTSEAHATLLFYIYGPCGTHVTNLVQGIERDDQKYRLKLGDFFRPYFSLLPNYSDKKHDCQPSAALATDWQHDALAGHGSYTNWQIDDNAEHGKPPKMALDEAIETIRQGLPGQGLWFAGEHTAPFYALGTVTGAYESGEAVAERIIESFKKD